MHSLVIDMVRFGVRVTLCESKSNTQISPVSITSAFSIIDHEISLTSNFQQVSSGSTFEVFITISAGSFDFFFRDLNLKGTLKSAGSLLLAGMYSQTAMKYS